MKKIFLWMMVGLVGLFTSCSEDALVGEEGGEITTISVTAPQLGLGTRAGATAFADPDLDGMRVALIISTEDNRVITVTTTTHDFSSGACTFEARLYKGKTYNLSVWADFGATYYTIPTQPTTTAEAAATLPVVKMASTTITGNDNKYDAYFGNETKTLSGNETINIVLSRPFALVKVNTTDWDENAVKLAGYRPDAYATTFNAPTQLNLVSGEADEAAAINTSASIVEYDKDGNPKQLHYDYLFANTTASILNAFTVEYKQNGATSSDYTFENIPVQRNYQTNITGNILTKNGKINVTIDPLWNQPETPVVLFTTYDEAQNYLNQHKDETGQTILSIDEEVKSGDTKNLYIPDNTKKDKWIFDLKNLQNGGNVNVYDEHPAGNDVNYKNEVEVHLPDGVTANNAYINTPNAHASMVGSFGTIDAATGDNTLVIEEGSTVGKLIVRKGGLEIHGTVNEVEVIIAGTDKVYVRDCEGLSQSVYDVLAPYIDIDNGYAGVQNGTTWDVKKGAATVVAKIGTKEYYTLAKAFADVQDGETIDLVTNATIGTTLAANTSFTLNLNNKVLTSNVSGAYVFSVASGKSFTLKDGSVADGSNGAATGLISGAATTTVSKVDFGTFNTTGNANILFPMNGNTSLTLTEVTVTTNNNVVKSSGANNALVVTKGSYTDTKRNSGTHTFDLLEYDSSTATFDGVTITSPDAAERQSCIETAATKGTANVVLKGCTIKAAYGNTVYAASDMTIINCEITTGNDSKNSYHALSVETEHTVNIYGGTYKALTSNTSSAALKIWTSGGIINVYDKYQGVDAPVVIEGYNMFFIDSKNKSDAVDHIAKVQLDGENIQTKGLWSQQHSAKIYVNGGYHDVSVWSSSNANTFILSGGTYTMDPRTNNCFVIADGYKVVENSGTPTTWSVIKNPDAGKVAKIGETRYDSFEAALSAVKANETITLIDDVTVGSNYTYQSSLDLTKNNVTLDLN